MNKKDFLGRSLRDLLVASTPSLLVLAIALFLAHKYIHPAPPNHIVISTGDGEGDYQDYAEAYKEIIARDGVTLDIRASSGARENLKRLEDPKSDVDVAFVQDGLDSKNPNNDLVSLGSLAYEPMWVFYRGRKVLSRFSELKGKRVAIGEHGGGTPALAMKLLKESGVQKNDVTILRANFKDSALALKKGEVDAIFFLATPEEELIKELAMEPGIRLMNVDQAEAISRKFPYLHHVVLPHGSLDLAKNVPSEDVHMVATTATLIARGSFHPALIDLLLKAATEVHGEPGILEVKNEFPVDKDYSFPISPEAKRFFKTGTPFWQRYLPFWLASLIDRFVLVILPLLAVLIPMLKSIPKILEYRVRSRISKCYGELKYLETQLRTEATHEKYSRHLRELDAIEERVRQLKVPLDFAEHVYVLREHIDFVRVKLDAELPPQAKTEVV